MAYSSQTDRQELAEAPLCEETVLSPSLGSYVTDGRDLFQLVDARSSHGELLFELEDCATFELVLCPVRRLLRLGLRTVERAAEPCGAGAGDC